MDQEELDLFQCAVCGADIDAPLHVDESCAPGELFASFSDPTTWVNAVTGPHRDTHTGTPEYKLTAVQIEKADA